MQTFAFASRCFYDYYVNALAHWPAPVGIQRDVQDFHLLDNTIGKEINEHFLAVFYSFVRRNVYSFNLSQSTKRYLNYNFLDFETASWSSISIHNGILKQENL